MSKRWHGAAGFRTAPISTTPPNPKANPYSKSPDTETARRLDVWRELDHLIGRVPPDRVTHVGEQQIGVDHLRPRQKTRLRQHGVQLRGVALGYGSLTAQLELHISGIHSFEEAEVEKRH